MATLCDDLFTDTWLAPVLKVDQAASGLLALGLKRGDRLGVWGPNIYEWILFQFATAKAGIIMVRIAGERPPLAWHDPPIILIFICIHGLE